MTNPHTAKDNFGKPVSEQHSFSGAPATNEERIERDLPKVIVFGNGPLADATLKILREHTDVIFHARAKADLAEAARLKQKFPKAFGILASFGVIIRPVFLKLFEPEGILNLHPSLLPKYRGASPIESAILAGDQDTWGGGR